MSQEPRLVLGIGSGRCGTKSLANILAQQPGAYVTHEIRPVLPWTEQESKARIAERITALRYQGRGCSLVGDVAHYYLNYVADAISLEPQLRVVCLRRDRKQVVESYYQWVRTSYGPHANHWRLPDGSRQATTIFSKCFPKYDTNDIKVAIGQYWDEYYKTAEQLVERFPGNVAVFDMHAGLNTAAGQQEVLSFVGVPVEQQTVVLAVHLHRSPVDEA